MIHCFDGNNVIIQHAIFITHCTQQALEMTQVATALKKIKIQHVVRMIGHIKHECRHCCRQRLTDTHGETVKE